MRAGGAEGDPEGDGRRTLVNGWESRLWRLEDKHLSEGSSVRQFGRSRPLRILHRRRRNQLTVSLLRLAKLHSRTKANPYRCIPIFACSYYTIYIFEDRKRVSVCVCERERKSYRTYNVSR